IAPGLAELERARGALADLLERDVDLVLHILPGLLGLAPQQVLEPASPAEEGPEEVGEAAHLLVLEAAHGDPRAPRPAAAPRRDALVGLPVRAHLVVATALLGVGEHLVGLVDLLEARLGLAVAGVDVGMVLARELAVGGLDLLAARGLRDAERLVVVL